MFLSSPVSLSSNDMAEKGKTRMKKGWMAVRVGLEREDEELQRFTIPISHLYHPLFQSLLQAAKDVYGYRFSGPLTLPCSVEDFLHIRWIIEQESTSPR